MYHLWWGTSTREIAAMASPRQHDSTEEPKLSAAQQTAIAALMLGKTYVEAAQEAGVTDRTIRRWRESSPDFELALRSQILAVKESASVIATTAAQTAMKTLASIAATPDHPHVLRAISMILKMNGPLPEIKAPTTLQNVSDEQLYSHMIRQVNH